MSRQLRIKNSQEEFTRLAEWVQGLGEQLALSADSLYRLDLVLTEAVTNIIQYAFPGGGEHLINIQVNRVNGAVIARISDEGIRFNPLSHQLPSQPRNLEEAPVGGLGILLMRKFSNACEYRRAAGKNILTVTIQELAEPAARRE